MKKNTRPATTDKPQSAQIEAIRRLAEHGDAGQARPRVAVLRRRFPAYRPLLALAWEIEDRAGEHWAAAARAFDWTVAVPGSEAAQDALAGSAAAAGLVALGNAAAIQLARLRGMPVPPLPGIDAPLGRMSGDETVLADLSRLLLTDQRYDEVIARLGAASHASLCNNRALARCAIGDLAGALADFDDNWRRQPHNLFALERLIRLRMWHHGRADAAQLAAPLRASVPLRAEDALGKLIGLILLGESRAAEDAYQSDGPDSEMFVRNAQLRGLHAYAGAVLALREGERATAAERLRLAGPDHEPGIALRAALAAGVVGGDCRVEVGEIGAWFPVSWYVSLSVLRDSTASDLEQQVLRLLDACDAHADYLGLAAELGGDSAGMLAIEVLKRRAQQGDQAATRELISLLTRPCGPDMLRVGLLNWLGAEKLIGGDGSAPMLANGKITEIRPLKFRLTPEPTTRPYSPAVQARLDRLGGLLRQQRLAPALDLALEICQLAPQVPTSHANVALIREALGAPDEVVEALLRRALELDADYLFARAGLARLLARRGEVDAAKAMIEPVYGRDEYHFSEWRAVLITQRELALAQGEADAVASLDQSLIELDELARR